MTDVRAEAAVEAAQGRAWEAAPLYVVGVDLGQSRDYTAIAVVEAKAVRAGWDGARWEWKTERRLAVRHLERVALGTPYQEVVERVVEVARSPALAGRRRLVVDGTGVGRPVVDLLRRARPGCAMTAVTVTSGDGETWRSGYVGVPKRELIVGLQVALESGGLKIAAGLKWGAELEKEMAEMRVRVTGSGREQYGAWREGTHDDLVFAVALAVWGAQVRTVGMMGDRRAV
ncbi:MAG TPA: hypothetical protein VMI93_12905 [Candidatus Solibacter sp.]|nr:hypothetical protein [Candidatus Solibacter sp.]